MGRCYARGPKFSEVADSEPDDETFFGGSFGHGLRANWCSGMGKGREKRKTAWGRTTPSVRLSSLRREIMVVFPLDLVLAKVNRDEYGLQAQGCQGVRKEREVTFGGGVWRGYC